MLSAPVSFDKNRILRSFSTSILSPRACTSSRPTRMKILRTLLQCRRTSVRSFPIPTRASRRVARRPRLSSTRDESSFLSFWREEVTRRMVSLANNRRGGIVKKSRIARASKETKREDVHDTPGGAFRSPKERRYFSHLWPKIPPINLVVGSFSHRPPRLVAREPRSLRSSRRRRRRQKRTTPRQRTPRQRRRARLLGAFFVGSHRNPPAAFDFFAKSRVDRLAHDANDF